MTIATTGQVVERWIGGQILQRGDQAICEVDIQGQMTQKAQVLVRAQAILRHSHQIRYPAIYLNRQGRVAIQVATLTTIHQIHQPQRRIQV